MAVTVVRGITNSGSSTGSSGDASADKKINTPHVNSANQATLSTVAGTQEAAVSVIRLARRVSVADRIQDPKEAKKLADEVAERIKSSDSGVEAHGELEPQNARDHLTY